MGQKRYTALEKILFVWAKLNNGVSFVSVCLLRKEFVTSPADLLFILCTIEIISHCSGSHDDYTNPIIVIRSDTSKDYKITRAWHHKRHDQKVQKRMSFCANHVTLASLWNTLVRVLVICGQLSRVWWSRTALIGVLVLKSFVDIEVGKLAWKEWYTSNLFF